jgi:NAD(P)-dependent dehydrogenase (short-subunit alcohol dehydrogenase family)
VKNKVALIIGAGDAIGSAIARKFAKRGLTICATRRNEDKLKPLIEEISAAGGKAFGFGCDARKEDATEALFKNIEDNIGEIDVVVFNVGANVPMGILETDSRKFFKIWEMACFAGFLNGR